MDQRSESVPCPVRSAALDAPGDPVIITPDRMITFAALDGLVSMVAGRLRARGIEKGDRVAIRVENRWELVVLILGCIRAGAVACPLNIRFPSVERLCARADARFLVTSPTDRRPTREAYPIQPKHPLTEIGLDALFHFDELLDPDELFDPDEPFSPDETSSPDEFLSVPEAENGPAAGRTLRLSVDQEATVVFTSGSTGEPRGALHSIGNHYYSALGSNENIRVQPGDRWLLSLPLYHVGGLGIVFRCLLGRAAIVVPGPGERELEAAFRATHVSMVATQLKRLLDLDAEKIPSLHAVLLGGSAIPPGLIDAALERAVPIHTSYGMTEMTSQVATTPPMYELARSFGGDRAAVRAVLGTSGRVLPHRELRIGPDGEVFVRGRTRFLGYVSGREIERPFDAAGWFATGDLGEIDSDGWLRIIGRRDNLFISGGENIMPEAIEAALTAGTGIRQAVVVPIPDPEFGQRPVAFLQAEGGSWDTAALDRAVERQLPRYMVPVRYFPWPSGEDERMKVDRAALRRRAEELMRDDSGG